MAMTVMNNPTAMITLGELNKNISNQGKSAKKLASGMKINSAGDDASAYSISERMRAQLRSLDQDIDNVKNGRALLKVAAGGIDNIVDELRNLKELALNAANDTNTDEDRATIQKEFDQKMANINDIAQETNYNGKILLDGRYGKISFGASGATGTNGTSGLNATSQNEPSGSVTVISAGNYTIASDGVYMLTSGYTGTVTIANGVQNVKIQQQNPSVALNEAFIVGPSSGNANLWIDNLNIENKSTDANIIKFQGTNNFLTTKGNNTLFRNDDRQTPGYTLSSAVINVGDGLTIEGANGSVLNVIMDGNGSPNGYAVSARDTASGAGIGSDWQENSNAYIQINSGNINVTMKDGPIGAGIGSGGDFATSGSIGDITITGGTINVQMLNAPNTGNNGAGIGSGNGTTAGDIKIDHATVNVTSLSGAGIGSGSHRGSVGNILIGNNAIINATSTRGGAGIGSGAGGVFHSYTTPSTAGDITISRQASITASSTMVTWTGIDPSQGDDIGAGENSTAGTVTYVDDLTIPGISQNNALGKLIENPLVIHHGTKANQALNCYINDMRTDALGLSNTKVSTRDDAIWALSNDKTGRVGAIDAAINYALDEATTIGAYISRLEFTEENLVTANENTQSSESTIRDADMAKEMTDYTKSNVLAQSAQSMLAQANQNSSNVLSLLQ